MTETNHQPGLGTLAQRLGKTALGALENRGELLAVEWQQERARLTGLLLLTVALLFVGIMAMLLLTATIIFLFPEDLRLYVAAAFTVLYLAGTGVLVFSLLSLLKREPFEETLRQLRKDRELLDSFK